MNYKIESAPLYQTTQSGLKRVFAYITSKNNSTSISSTDFTDLNGLNPSDMPFVQLLEQIAKASNNSNQSISNTDFDTIINNINRQGLSQDQLNIIYSQSSSDSQKEMIEKVISNFRRIDENGDGKVSKSEMDKYFLKKEVDDKKTEFSKVKSSNYTMFYNDTTEISTNTDDSSDVSTSTMID